MLRSLGLLVGLCLVLARGESEEVIKCTGGECVKLHLCPNGELNTDGMNIIDIRFNPDNECEDYLLKCCPIPEDEDDDDDQVVAPPSSVIPSTPVPVPGANPGTSPGTSPGPSPGSVAPGGPGAGPGPLPGTQPIGSGDLATGKKPPGGATTGGGYGGHGSPHGHGPHGHGSDEQAVLVNVEQIATGGSAETANQVKEPGQVPVVQGGGPSSPGPKQPVGGVGSQKPGESLKPVDAGTKPGAGGGQPGSGSGSPGGSGNVQGGGSPKPGAGTGQPGSTGSGSGTQPGPGATQGVGSPKPGAGTGQPGSAGSGTQPGPGATLTVPGSGSPVGSGNLQGSGSPKPGAGTGQPGSAGSGPGTQTGPGATQGVGSPKPGAGTGQPGSAGSGSGTQTGPGATQTGPGSGSPVGSGNLQGSGSPKPGAGTGQPGSAGSGPGTQTGPGATQGVGSPNPGAGTGQPGSVGPAGSENAKGTATPKPGAGVGQPGSGTGPQTKPGGASQPGQQGGSDPTGLNAINPNKGYGSGQQQPAKGHGDTKQPNVGGGHVTKPADKVGAVTTNPLDKTVDVPQQCGLRNVDGVGFRITGDNEGESEYGEFPWMVAILKEEKALDQVINVYQCGGSLIHPKVVLTAAHCTQNRQASEMKARLGEWDTQTKNEMYDYQDRNVVEIVVHPEFYKGGLFNDVALLFLDQPADLMETVNTLCLPPANHNFDLSRCFASGWGKDQFGKAGTYQVILKKIELPVVPRDKCQAALRTTRLGRRFKLHGSFICAGGEKGRDTCKGDGGSPLICPIPGTVNRYYQAGMVAWGIGCGEDGIPGVYVNVPMFRTWIDEHLQQRNIPQTYYLYQ